MRRLFISTFGPLATEQKRKENTDNVEMLPFCLLSEHTKPACQLAFSIQHFVIIVPSVWPNRHFGSTFFQKNLDWCIYLFSEMFSDTYALEHFPSGPRPAVQCRTPLSVFPTCAPRNRCSSDAVALGILQGKIASQDRRFFLGRLLFFESWESAALHGLAEPLLRMLLLATDVCDWKITANSLIQLN